MKLKSNETYTIITREHIIEGFIEHIHEELHAVDYNTLIKQILHDEDEADDITVTIEANIIRKEYNSEHYMDYIIFNNNGTTQIIYDTYSQEFVPMSANAIEVFNTPSEKEVR